MIKDVVSLGLPVGEKLAIRKNSIKGKAGDEKRRVCIVTGTHGDELEGQYVAWRLNRIFEKNIDKLHGSVDIYPANNPLGISTIYRGMPGYDLDMNRMFPGSEDSSGFDYMVKKIHEDIVGADLCIDIHASNIFLREIPQIRINELSAEELLPYAKTMNMDFVWIHSAATVLQSTLAYSLNELGTPTLVVEMGVGMRITEKYGNQLIDGILATMKKMGLWDGEEAPTKPPIISTDGHVGFINSDQAGLFLPYIKHGERVRKNELIGVVADSLTGEIREEVRSPISGLVFTLREYPVVYDGSLIARVLGGSTDETRAAF
ncbi:MAG: succinylglutamate desuccinylase/aspartoacylase family protein [Lachnospiraceae bacterium]|nr:succinylglutamate desuccinylase/aspartoacylase family protein [Lachnospiraceae bacterium]